MSLTAIHQRTFSIEQCMMGNVNLLSPTMPSGTLYSSVIDEGRTLQKDKEQAQQS